MRASVVDVSEAQLLQLSQGTRRAGLPPAAVFGSRMVLTTPALPALAMRNSITLTLLIAARVSLLGGSFGDRVGGPVTMMPRETEKPYTRFRLTGRGKTQWGLKSHGDLTAGAGARTACSMLKMSPHRGRSERKGESYSVSYVEPLSDARTKLADVFSTLRAPKRVRSRDGWSDGKVFVYVAAAVRAQRPPPVGHWIPLPYDGGLSRLLPPADSISIGVPPQFLAQHDRSSSRTLRSPVRHVERLVVTTLFIERVGRLYSIVGLHRVSVLIRPHWR